MKVSIIIPTYNQSQYVKLAVDSALNQTYDNIEVIVSDDSTNNETEQLLAPYSDNPKFRYIKNKSPRGRVNNYHFLLHECATGDYVLNIDGDDYLNDLNYIENAIKLIENNNDIVWVMAGAKIINETNTYIVEKIPLTKTSILSGKDYFFNYYHKIDCFFHSSTLYHRQKAIEVGYYQFDSLNTDANSLLKLALLGNVFLIAESPLSWRCHSKNASKKINIDEGSQEILAFYDVADFARSLFSNQQIDHWLHSISTYMNKGFVYQLIKLNRKTEARQLLNELPFGWYRIKQEVKLFLKK